MTKSICFGAVWALFLLVGTSQEILAELDTTSVQTFTFEAQNNPATSYESPGRRWFDFPASDNGVVYGKVLMDYTLKCFEDGTAGGLGYACGEWDYLTYTYLFDHTGLLDSALVQHGEKLLADQAFDQADLLPFSEGVADSVWVAASAGFVSEVMMESLASPAGATAGAWEFLEANTSAESDVARAQYLWTAEELSELGEGPIHRLELAGGASAVARRLDVRWALVEASQDSLAGWTEGLQSSYAFAMNGEDGLEGVNDGALSLLLTPPIVWDGVSNLVLDFAVEGLASESPCLGDSLIGDLAGRGWATASGDHYVEFTAPDRVGVDAADLAGLDSAITVECWVKGDAALQPENGTLFEGVNSAGQRVVNVHLPWSNGRVYWDCGQEGGYDRIDAPAAFEDYAGRWVHWAFTKDVASGAMAIYKDGVLWHSGQDKVRPILDVVRMNVGSAAGWSNYYNGAMDDFRIWDVALDEATIFAWKDRAVEASHPAFDDLLVAYTFEGGNGTPEENLAAGGGLGYHHGTTLRRERASRDLFKGGGAGVGDGLAAVRPRVKFGRGQYLVAIADGAVLELHPVAPLSLSSWSLVDLTSGSPGSGGAGNTGVEMTAMSYHFLPGSTYSVAMTGDTVSTQDIPGATETVFSADLTYYNAPFEVVNRVELNRFITPYGIGLSLGDDGWTWTSDVTDYLPLLRDSVELQAGNWQELLDLKFRFIEGEPARQPLRVESFWHGQYGLSTFDENVAAHVHDPELEEEMWRLVTRASGHGFGSGNNCAEFCNNTHRVSVNGSQQWDWQIMRECADNPLYPQGGTWIYDRAGWCPGMPTDTRTMELTPLLPAAEPGAPAAPFSLEYDVDYDPYGNYRLEGQVIAYGPALHTLDAELVEVLAPNSGKLQSRFNPICDRPRVVLRNSGSQPLTSCIITFGRPEAPQSFAWTGELQFLEQEELTLTSLDEASWFLDGEDASAPVMLNFFARVSMPNGTADPVVWNDEVHSTFHRPPSYTYMDDPGDPDDNRVIVWVKTNSTPLETSASLVRADGTVYFEKQYTEPNTTHRDTVYLNEGCYTFQVFDSDDDGISFWANDDGSGYVRLRKVGGNLKTFEADFGKGILHNFHFETDLVNSVDDLQGPTSDSIRDTDMVLTLYPNPVRGDLHFTLQSSLSGPVYWSLYDATGRKADSGRLNVGSEQRVQGSIPMEHRSKGLYTIEFASSGEIVKKRIIVD